MNEEFNKFIDDIKTTQPSIEDALGLPKDAPLAETKPEPEEEVSESQKNRRHRRLEQNLAREREARIAAEARATAIAEMNLGATTGDVDPLLVQLYGTEDRGKEAAALHQKLLESYAQKAREEALNEFESRQSAQQEQVRQFEAHLDSEFETLEDQYDLDLTSNAPAARKARNEILELLEKISPKDNSGNITEYADMDGVYEMWKLKREQQKGGVSERQKEAASRPMVKGDNSPAPAPEPSRGWGGWRRDLFPGQ